MGESQKDLDLPQIVFSVTTPHIAGAGGTDCSPPNDTGLRWTGPVLLHIDHGDLEDAGHSAAAALHVPHEATLPRQALGEHDGSLGEGVEAGARTAAVPCFWGAEEWMAVPSLSDASFAAP